jgi:hypothetical protein
MSYADGLQDYVDVAERISQLFTKYPDASIQTNYEGIVETATGNYLIMKATVYRTPDDLRPAIDYAWELVPGKTPYSKGSELMVGSTSATGRAIAMLGIATKRSIATKQEVQAAKDRQAPGPAKPKEVDPWAIIDEPDLSIPTCRHGAMRRKTGLKKDGTPYGGYVCTVGGEGDRCDAIWDRS